jgi:regulator of sigma E protease
MDIPFIFDIYEFMVGTLLPFLVVLTAVIFFHELGHFAVARWCGVGVSTFSIGIGPEIFGFDDKQGTRWRFAWLPIGGYVKFIDDADATSTIDANKIEEIPDSEKDRCFHYKPLWQKAAVVAAGPIANFILAIVILTVLFATLGRNETMPIVDNVVENSAAERAGFKSGDVILKVDDADIDTFSQLVRAVSVNDGAEMKFLVQRDEQVMTLLATPERKETTDHFGNKITIPVLGISRSLASPGALENVSYNPASAFLEACKQTWFVITRTLSFISGIFAGQEDHKQLGGPIMIAKLSSQTAEVGLATLANFVAMISVSIGLLNLFPIPVLDGGHLLFYLIEAIKGSPLNAKAQEVSFRIGMALLLALMVFATWNDISRVFLPA